MSGRTTIFIFFAILVLSGVALAKEQKLDIKVEPAADTRFRISISFTGNESGTTAINLPNEWGGQRELFKAIHGLNASPATVRLTETDAAHRKTLTHRPGERITLSYLIGQDFEGPFANSVRYRPVVDKDHIHWIGNTVWALPAWDDATLVKVTIEWKKFPKNWKLANSFAAGKRKQSSFLKIGELRQAIFVAGDFRIIRTKAAGNQVNIAIRGAWQFTDAELAEMTRKIVEVERNFFNDHSQKYYLVTLVPIDAGGPNSISTGGTGLTDSFALFSTSNARLDRFRQLLAHEYAHNWIPGKLGGMPAKDEQSLYWFSEGFTDFYTYELLHRGNIISEREYVDRYNELIREYIQLPVREAPNERIVKEFWSDQYVQRLPYLRGLLFATNLNAAIKRASGGKRSLDDVIHDMFKAARSSKQELSFESLAAAFRVYLGEDPMPLMRRQLINGELIVPAADALGPGIAQATVEIPIFELGFDFDKFVKDRIVAGLDPNSSAYAAGLRNGQQRTGGFSFSFGDTSKEIELKVKDTEGEKTVKFLPIAPKRLTVPQYILH